ncbi:MAG: TetR/AcrR family transcriptional regulator [Flavobacterium sp.]|nr:TetR/AcrR family transcriptional regulator [Pedobacter sp.]
MTTAEELQNAYVDYVLTHGAKPKSVYIFAKENNLSEQEFYNFFGSFAGIEESIWTHLISKALTEVQAQEVWAQYTAREKTLAFFYGFIELLKSKRSFALYTLKDKTTGTPQLLREAKNVFEIFASDVIQQGIETRELADRRFFSQRYKDALWVQFGFIINFWSMDSSANFEKTDEAIEKGINVTFDLFERSALDSLIDYGKFMVNNGGFKQKMKF